MSKFASVNDVKWFVATRSKTHWASDGNLGVAPTANYVDARNSLEVLGEIRRMTDVALAHGIFIRVLNRRAGRGTIGR